jgi:hypothetical protein
LLAARRPDDHRLLHLRSDGRSGSASYDSDAADEEGVEKVIIMLKRRFDSRAKVERESSTMLANLNHEQARKV